MDQPGGAKTMPVGKASCPRCGYDQRGPVVAWTDACPLEGTCTECGLVFRWAEVLRPEKFEPRWCVEFAPARWLVFAAARTFWRSLRPWSFWSRLRMSQRVRWRRLATYAVLLLGPLLLAYVLAQGSAAIYVRWWYGQQFQQYRARLPAMIQSLQSMRDAVAASDQFEGRRGVSAEEKAASLQRIDGQMQRLRAQLAAMPTVDHSYAEAALEGIVFPTRKYSWGSIGSQAGVGAGQYVPPIEIWYIVSEALSRSGRPTGRLAVETLSETAMWLGLGVAVVLVFPLTLILLPISRRRAKVQWRHIGRVTVYGLIIPVVVILAGGLLTGYHFLFDDGSWGTRMLWLARLGPALLLVLWWAAAVGRYLRIPHGLAVAVVHTALAALLVVGAMWPFLRGAIVDWYWS